MTKKLCIIIGVGPGMGMAIARKFGSEGFKLALVARKKEALSDYKKELEKEGFEANTYPADVSDFEALSKTFDSIESECGKAEVLVYNVSILNPGIPSEIDPESLVRDFKVNVVGALVAAQKVTPQMKENADSTIIFTGGGLALNPYYEYASLGVGKAGIRNLAYSLSQELKAHNIRVATVTINGMIEKGTHFDPGKIAEEYWKIYSKDPKRKDAEIIYD